MEEGGGFFFRFVGRGGGRVFSVRRDGVGRGGEEGRRRSALEAMGRWPGSRSASRKSTRDLSQRPETRMTGRHAPSPDARAGNAKTPRRLRDRRGCSPGDPKRRRPTAHGPPRSARRDPRATRRSQGWWSRGDPVPATGRRRVLASPVHSFGAATVERTGPTSRRGRRNRRTWRGSYCFRFISHGFLSRPTKERNARSEREREGKQER